MSTEPPYLIGSLTTYSNKHKWVDLYESLIRTEHTPDWKIGKANGYRCFVVWYGALEDVRESDFDDNMKLYIKRIMEDMADYALTQLSEGNLKTIQEYSN